MSSKKRTAVAANMDQSPVNSNESATPSLEPASKKTRLDDVIFSMKMEGIHRDGVTFFKMDETRWDAVKAEIDDGNDVKMHHALEDETISADEFRERVMFVVRESDEPKKFKRAEKFAEEVQGMLDWPAFILEF
jgi:hypothetical protein